MVRRSTPEPPTVRDGLVRQRVLVTMADDQGFEGVLWQADSTGVVLRGAAGGRVEFVEASGERHEIDGEVFVPEGRVLFVQILEAGS